MVLVPKKIPGQGVPLINEEDIIYLDQKKFKCEELIAGKDYLEKSSNPLQIYLFKTSKLYEINPGRPILV